MIFKNIKVHHARPWQVLTFKQLLAQKEAEKQFEKIAKEVESRTPEEIKALNDLWYSKLRQRLGY